MKILADKYLYKLDELLPDNIELNLFDPDEGFPEHVTGFDALLIRTVTKINKQTLPVGGKLRFIGSATAGHDHVDREHLENIGLAFSNSEGCNANAVAEYVITVLSRWSAIRNKELQKLRIGIIGCGNTGGAVLYYLDKLGIENVAYDPPKAVREPGFESDSLERLLACDVLTFHTPLTFSGDDATYHLCNKDWLQNGFELIINAARGGVVDENALISANEKKKVQDFILDVWENEPFFMDVAAKNTFIATPHIAGYSKQAKFRATEMVVHALCEVLGLQKKEIKTKTLYPSEEVKITGNLTFDEFLWNYSNIGFYDESMRKLLGLPDEKKALKYAKLRSETETRDEFVEVVQRLRIVPDNLSELSVFKRWSNGAM
jgi:erythronate-4-phosphate dehydrogenase